MQKLMFYHKIMLLFSALMLCSNTTLAALNNINETNSSASAPYAVTVSYNGENSQIISSEGTIQNKSYVSVGDGVKFSGTTYSGPSASGQTQNLHGSVVYAFNSVINFAGNNVFDGNKFNSGRNTYGVIYAASPYRIGEYGQPKGAYSNDITFGNNTLFENNSAVMGNVIVADAAEGGKNTFTFGDNTQFKNNITARNQVGNGGNGGVIMSAAYGDQDHITGNTFNFGNKTLFEGNRGVRGGVFLTDIWAEGTSYVTNNFNFYGDVSFINNRADGSTELDQTTIFPPLIKNKADADLQNPSDTIKQTRATGYGGVIYGEVFGNDDAHADNYFNFYGTTVFSGNFSQGIGGAVVFMSDNEKPENINDIMNFAPQEKGQYVLFENNTGAGQLNSFYIVNTKLNFNLQKGTYASIRDPIYATGLSQLNKGAEGVPNGDGGLYLWGNNDDFSGTVNINAGSFYAMFEENQTDAQKSDDPLGQRSAFSMQNAKVNFGANTLFRPMMNANRDELAQLNMTNVNGASNATLVPYEISKLETRNYEFNNNYEGFKGFDTPLAELVVNGNTSVLLNIKRNLAGYEGLSDAVEAYRQSDLNFIDREVLDDIYLTGNVSSEIKDLFATAGGNDYVNYSHVHRATVRQFNRQVGTRLHNQDSLGNNNHLWVNGSYNKVKKDEKDNHPGYKYEPKGFAVGYDFETIPGQWINGVAFSYTYGKVKTLTGSDIYDHDEVDNYLASIYGKFKKNGYYANWNFGGGYFTNKTKLMTQTMNARGKYDSNAWFANGEAGYNFGKKGLTFEPFLGLEYTYLRSEAYDEKGEGARHFDKADWNVFETPLGLRLGQRFDLAQTYITPSVEAAYAHNFGDSGISTFGSFIGGSGRWRVSAPTDSRDSLRAAASLKINQKFKPIAFHLGYAIDHRSDYNDQQFFATLRWDF